MIHTRQQGFTLVELMVAVFILAIVALGAAFLQINALQASRDTRITREMNEEARSELEAQRRLNPTWASYTSQQTQSCLTISQGTCEVVLYPCEQTDVSGTETFVCSNNVAASDLLGHEVIVNYSRDGQSVSVSTIAVLPAQFWPQP